MKSKGTNTLDKYFKVSPSKARSSSLGSCPASSSPTNKRKRSESENISRYVSLNYLKDPSTLPLGCVAFAKKTLMCSNFGYDCCYTCGIPFESTRTMLWNRRYNVLYELTVYNTLVSVCSESCSQNFKEFGLWREINASSDEICAGCGMDMNSTFYDKALLNITEDGCYCSDVCKSMFSEFKNYKISDVAEEEDKVGM